MRKYITLNLLFAAALFLASACSDRDIFGTYLDKAPSSQLPEDSVFHNFDYVERYHSDIYNFMRSGLGLVNASWLDSGSDLAETSFTWGGVNSSFNAGNYFSDAAYTELVDTWSSFYMGIRKCNIYLERVDSVPLKPGETAPIRLAMVKGRKAETRFLRAFFYWELVLRYGGVPLITKSLTLTDNLEIPRSSYDDCVKYIVNELDSVSTVLPVSYSLDQYGRVTSGAALGLKSRILLFYASPRNNPSGDVRRWMAAAAAAYSVIKTNTYSLYNDYTSLFWTRNNPELIWWRNDAPVAWWRAESPVSFGGYGGLCPTQELVDMYDMKNGEPPVLGYLNDSTPIVNPASGYDPSDPYKNRDPRFYATVLYNGSTWWNLPIETFQGGKDKPLGNLDATPTGYYSRKYKDDQQNDYLDASKLMYRNWIFIRYAEILLNYAEARNEILSSPDEECFTYIEKVRSRNGYGITTPLPRNLTKEEMRQRIRKERAVELCFEDHRWWDVRRWNIAKEILGKPIHGMKIIRQVNNAAVTYTYKVEKVEDRVFDDRMYLYPIPQSEIIKYKNMPNNPGW